MAVGSQAFAKLLDKLLDWPAKPARLLPVLIVSTYFYVTEKVRRDSGKTPIYILHYRLPS